MTKIKFKVGDRILFEGHFGMIKWMSNKEKIAEISMDGESVSKTFDVPLSKIQLMDRKSIRTISIEELKLKTFRVLLKTNDERKFQIDVQAIDRSQAFEIAGTYSDIIFHKEEGEYSSATKHSLIKATIIK